MVSRVDRLAALCGPPLPCFDHWVLVFVSLQSSFRRPPKLGLRCVGSARARAAVKTEQGPLPHYGKAFGF